MRSTPSFFRKALSRGMLFLMEADEDVRPAGRDQGREDPLAEPHVRFDRAAPLGHAVDFGLLHVVAGEHGRPTANLGGLQDPLSADAAERDAVDFVVRRP